MTKYLIALLLCLTGCYHHVDLTKPACIVIPWEEDIGILAEPMLNGWRLWFRHLPNVPYPIIVRERESCDNVPFEVHIVEALDGRRIADITYKDWGYRIRIERAYATWPTVFAHEYGHAFLEDYGHIPDKYLSIMNKETGTIITPRDMYKLCDTHEEIECPEWDWCKDTFSFEGWCPSDSPEEGLEKVQRENSYD